MVPLACWASAPTRNAMLSPTQVSSSTTSTLPKVVRALPNALLIRRMASSLPRRWGIETMTGCDIGLSARKRGLLRSNMLAQERHVADIRAPEHVEDIAQRGDRADDEI